MNIQLRNESHMHHWDTHPLNIYTKHTPMCAVVCKLSIYDSHMYAIAIAIANARSVCMHLHLRITFTDANTAGVHTRRRAQPLAFRCTGP